MQNSKCPLCNSDIIIEDEAYEGDLVSCINCGAELEISSLKPLNLTPFEPDVEKDVEEADEIEENESMEVDDDNETGDMEEE
jgi:lysine biosynthesis protein LysW